MKRRQRNIFDNPQKLLMQGLVIGLGGFGVYFVGNKLIQNYRQRSTLQQADESPAIQQAMVLRNAMNPSGISWMMSMDTTNTDTLFNTARQIYKLDEVSKAYRKLYGNELLLDLQSELSSEEYQNFLNIISSNANKNNPNAATNYAKKNQIVVAKLPVIVRTSPEASNHGALYESDKNNIYYQAKAGTFIGYATGNQHYDEKNKVKFIQVAFLVKKEGLTAAQKKYAGKSYSMWVSSSTKYVNIYNSAKDALSQYPAIANVIAYKKPLDYYQQPQQENLKGILRKMVVSSKECDIHDENLKAYTRVEPNTILGEYSAKLQMKGKTMLKFITIDRLERWVDERNVKMIEV